MRTQVIQDMNEYLPKYILDIESNNSALQQSKDEIPDIVTTSGDDEGIIIIDSTVFENDKRLISSFDEELLESLFNLDDESAGYKLSGKFKKLRVYKREIILKLKQHYSGNCQICGRNFADEYGVDITEAHHIDYFCHSLNNNRDNIVILCPNHHALIHKVNPKYDKEMKTFLFPNGTKMELTLNSHL